MEKQFDKNDPRYYECAQCHKPGYKRPGQRTEFCGNLCRKKNTEEIVAQNRFIDFLLKKRKGPIKRVCQFKGCHKDPWPNRYYCKAHHAVISKVASPWD